MENLPVFAVVVAGGKGLRLDPQQPKQYLPVAGKPILVHTLERFYSSHLFKQVIVVLPEQEVGLWTKFCTQHHLDLDFFSATQGGKSRFESVGCGLQALHSIISKKSLQDGWVAVHDAVRPFITQPFLSSCLQEAYLNNNAVPALVPIETFRLLKNAPENTANNQKSEKSTPLNREILRSIQTPQITRLSLFLKAWEKAEQAPFSQKSFFTDEASVLEYAGEKIHLCPGLEYNLKITRPIDLEWAAFLMEKGY